MKMTTSVLVVAGHPVGGRLLPGGDETVAALRRRRRGGAAAAAAAQGAQQKRARSQNAFHGLDDQFQVLSLSATRSISSRLTGFYWVSLCFTGSNWVLLCRIEFSWVLVDCHRILQGCTWF